MLDKKIFYHFIHNVKLGAPSVVNDDPTATLEGAVEIFSNLDMDCLESFFMVQLGFFVFFIHFFIHWYNVYGENLLHQHR